MNKTCLMIMNARDIPECTLSLKALKIDKAWLRGYTETKLEAVIEKFIKDSSYDRYILVSDDVIATEQALENLLRFQEVGPVVTGWCNVFPGETVTNLELKPIIVNRDFYLKFRDHIPRFTLPLIKLLWDKTPLQRVINTSLYRHFPVEDEIWAMPAVFRTYFVGWALTSMTREVWLKYGFHYMSSNKAGHGSDQKMSLDLGGDGITMLCARDSFIYHLRTTRNFIVGKVKPEVIFEGDPMMIRHTEYNLDYIR